MASWAVKIAVADLPSKLVNVTATRTDGEDVQNYTLSGLSVDTHDRPLADIRAWVVAKLRAMHEKTLADNAKIAALLSGWEAALVSDLDALET